MLLPSDTDAVFHIINFILNYNLSFKIWKDVFDEKKVNIEFYTFLNKFPYVIH
jgi:hypothetical protein